MPTTGIILAGGKSSRMGTNKALIELSGKKLIEIIYEKIRYSVLEVLIISNSPEDYKNLGLKVFKDIYPGLGPLSGIHSGLFNSNTEKNFIISCDLPLISKDAVEYITNYKSNKDAVIYKKGNRLQYLCGVYKKSCLSALNISLISRELKVQEFINKIDAEILDADRFSEEIFFNLNNKEDYENLIKMNLSF